MTPAQQARLEGFNASLTERGVSLQVHPNGATFTALVEPVEPENTQFQVGADVERETSRIHVLRPVPTGFAVGANLRDSTANRFHRVVRISDHPTSIAVVAHCETSEPA